MKNKNNCLENLLAVLVFIVMLGIAGFIGAGIQQHRDTKKYFKKLAEMEMKMEEIRQVIIIDNTSVTIGKTKFYRQK